MKKKNLNKVIISITIPLIITLLLYLLKETHSLKTLEMIGFDKKVQLSTKHDQAHQDIVVILIDEASLKTMAPLIGRWPWPRSIYKELLSFLSNAGAKAVLFDILFTEPQVPRDAQGNLAEDDNNFAVATMDSGNLHHAFQLVNDIEDEYNKNLLNKPLPTDFISKFALQNNNLKGNEKNLYNNYYIPFNELYQSAAHMAVVEFTADFDGIYRSTHLIRDYQKNFFPVLAISAIMNNRNLKIEIKDHTLKIDDNLIPLDKDDRYLINMKKKFNNYSISGIFASIQKINKGEVENLIVKPEEFKDKIVFIGASAVGLKDLKYTSIGKSVPGVYLHASIASNILSKSYIKNVNELLVYTLSLFVAIILSILILFPHNLVPAGIFFFLSLSIHSFINFYLYDSFLLLSPLVGPIFILLFTLLFAVIYKTFTEGKDKRFLQKAFKNYISPELIDIMFESGTLPVLGGDVGKRTAFFTDIQSFSTFSEKLSAPQLVTLLNEYLSAMTNILLKEGGTLDKYEGDAIVAFFGAPMPLEDHVDRAFIVALKMQDRLAELRVKWKSEGSKWPEIVHNMRMRVGINSGEIVTGNMGSESRMNYTMMGDAVNLAARLEAAAKQYGVFIQLSSFSKALALNADNFHFRELDTIKVVGKSEPVTTYELLGIKGETAEHILKLQEKFHSGLHNYKNQQWDLAIADFTIANEYEYQRFPDLKAKINPSKVYLERCQQFKENPPEKNWDGVFTLTEK
ncbi:MAG: CHASE2 domain-containing protein [Oligoflexia bacterium]|nr:CHASE2 domain-containing protein [Oligoflexia bacterium]